MCGGASDAQQQMIHSKDAKEHTNAFEMRSGALALLTPSGGQVAINGSRLVAVQFLAEGAQGAGCDVGVPLHDCKVPFPLEILVVQSIVGRQSFEQIGQLSGTELRGVDEGMRRSDGRVIGRSHHDGNDAPLKGVEEFLGHVVVAERILKGQVEFVFGVDHVVATIG